MAPDRRLVVRSIGTAGAAIVRALAQVMPIAAERLARLLYQAPAELMDGLDPAQAAQLAGVLGDAGLVCDILGPDDQFDPGVPEFEVALVVADDSPIGDVAALVTVLLGVDAATAREIVCSSPAVLLGHVSAATVDALRARFAAVGARLDATRPAAGTFDVFLGDCSPTDRHLAAALVHDLGLPAAGAAAAPLLASGLSHADATRLWERVQRTALPVRIVDRAYLRFDLTLRRAAPSEELAGYLVHELGVPAEVAPAVLQSLPLVVAQDLDASELADHLAALGAFGAEASGQCLSFDGFGLVVEGAADAEASVRILTSLGGVTAGEAAESLRSGEPLPRPMTRNRARWLQQELAAVGTASRVVVR